MTEITRQPIDTAALLRRATTPQAGAVVLFVGVTREFTGGRRTLHLEYDAYESMALAKLDELEADARRRWPLVECLMVHRLGRVDLGEASVAIAVSSPHRQAAFDAGQWLIDTLKQVVPIWKQEHWEGGQRQWVHPSGATPAGPTEGRLPDGSEAPR